MISTIAFISALAISGLLSFYPKVKPVDWADEIGEASTWNIIHGSAFALATAASAFVAFTWPSDDVLFLLAAAVSAGILSVALVYSAVTDVKARKVDRRVLNGGTALATPFALATLIERQDWTTLITSAVLFALGVVIYLFVFAIGASDARAIMLISVTAIPVVGYFGFMWAVIGCSLLFIVTAVGLGVRHGSFRVSLPAAPVLIAPFWLVLLTYQMVAYSTL